MANVDVVYVLLVNCNACNDFDDAEFKIRNGQYLDKWPNTSTNIWPFTKVYDHFI